LFERYSGEGRAAHYPDLARDVVSRNPDLIIAITNETILDLNRATTTIPIVGVYQIGFGAFTGMGCPKGVDAPAFWLTACD
jgi:ABC-type uncharacterized transport system substrate-binding protein